MLIHLANKEEQTPCLWLGYLPGTPSQIPGFSEASIALEDQTVSLQSGRQTLASFSPSAPDNSLPSFCTHSQSKSVSTFTFNITWLKCSFTHCIIPFVVFGLLYLWPQCKIIIPSTIAVFHFIFLKITALDSMNAGYQKSRDILPPFRAYHLLC